MKRLSVPLLAFLIFFLLVQSRFAGDNRLPKEKISYSSAHMIVPTMARVQGANGAFFKTRVSILNVTSYSYSIYATLYGPNGIVGMASIPLGPMQQKSWDDFLIFWTGFSGGGAIEFDSWFGPPNGSSNYEFLVTSEVYVDGPGGRYKTVVEPSGSLEEVGGTYQAFSAGIFVDHSSRSNIGCFNASLFSPQTVTAELYDNNGVLLNSYSLALVTDGWKQVSIGDPVRGGYVRWTAPYSCHCWAVVVDNISNDGTYIPARSYIP